MGKCLRCGCLYLGDRRFCPKCKTDVWYDIYGDGSKSFRELQKESRRVLQKGNLVKAAFLLDIALDGVIYRKEEHSTKELYDAVADRVLLFSEQKGREGEERMEDILEFLEDECRVKNARYENDILLLRREAALYLPQQSAKTRTEIDYPEKRDYWHLPLPGKMADAGEEAGYEPELSRQKHLTVTECFLYLYQNCDAIVRFLQSQDVLTAEVVYERVLPMIHSELNEAAVEHFPGAGRFADIFCSLLEDGFGRLAGIYLDPRPVDELEERLSPLIERCVEIGRQFLPDCPEICAAAAVAPLLGSHDTAPAVLETADPVFGALWAAFDRMEKRLPGLKEPAEVQSYRSRISSLFAEYSAVFGASEYLTGLLLKEDDESFLDAMEMAAGNGILKAAEELARSYFYGYHGCTVSPGYAKFYTQMLTIRGVSGSIAEAVESIPDLEMLVPGTDD